MALTMRILAPGQLNLNSQYSVVHDWLFAENILLSTGNLGQKHFSGELWRGVIGKQAAGKLIALWKDRVTRFGGNTHAYTNNSLS